MPENKTVHILCVNDFHAELMESEAAPGCAKLAGAVQEFLAKHPNTIVVFGGDNYRGDPVSEYTDGTAVTALMHTLGVTASALGNHELDFTAEELRRWQEEGSYSFLAANLRERSTGVCPKWAKPYVMVDCSGVRIALLGLSTREELDTAAHPSDIRTLELTDGTAAARYWVDFLRAGKDPQGVPHAILALTHYGLKQVGSTEAEGPELQALCREVSGIDGAFAAHWHQFMALHLGDVPVAQGGCRGHGFALLTLTLTAENHLLHVEPSFVDLRPGRTSLPIDPATAGVVADCYSRAMVELGEQIGFAPCPIPHRDCRTNEVPVRGTALTALALRVMSEYTDCPIALFYSGWIIDGLPAGEVTLYRLYQSLRFNHIVVTMTLTGHDLLRNLEQGLRTLNGEGASPLAVGGLCVTADMGRPAGRRLISATLPDGTPISPDGYYPVAVDDALAGNSMGFDFSAGTDRTYHEPSVRALMIAEIRRTGLISPELPTNITLT